MVQGPGGEGGMEMGWSGGSWGWWGCGWNPAFENFARQHKPVDECFGGDKRPIFLNRTNVRSLDVAQVGDTLYYFSAGFLTFKQREFTSCLRVDRPLLKLECRVAARVSLVAGLSYLESIVRCRGGK